MIEVASFFVVGVPQPGGSKRGFYIPKIKRVIITDANAKAKPWKDSVAGQAVETYKLPPVEGPLELTVIYYLPRPQGHFKTGKNSNELRASAPRYPEKKPDVLKLTRSTEDALTGILWRDDSQIVNEKIYKRYVDELHPHPGAAVMVFLLQPATMGNIARGKKEEPALI
jgi:Holliday junction resolvase RusA-like endonuclease